MNNKENMNMPINDDELENITGGTTYGSYEESPGSDEIIVTCRMGHTFTTHKYGSTVNYKRQYVKCTICGRRIPIDY